MVALVKVYAGRVHQLLDNLYMPLGRSIAQWRPVLVICAIDVNVGHFEQHLANIHKTKCCGTIQRRKALFVQ